MGAAMYGAGEGSVCPQCGSTENGALFCKKCGATLRPPVPLIPYTAKSQATPVEDQIPPGVTGWLFFFCVILTFLYPATSLYYIVTHTVPSLMGQHRFAFTLLLSIYCMAFSSIAVFSLVAGLKLWLVKPDAVKFARTWLWTYLLTNFA
jgi:hypothetical protein